MNILDDDGDIEHDQDSFPSYLSSLSASDVKQAGGTWNKIVGKLSGSSTPQHGGGGGSHVRLSSVNLDKPKLNASTGKYLAISPRIDRPDNHDDLTVVEKTFYERWGYMIALAWDYLLVLLMLYTFLALPIILAFIDDSEPTVYTYVDYAVDLVFVLDLFVLMRRRRMSRPFLMIYILCIFPFYALASWLPDEETALAEFIHLFRLCKFLRLIRGFRLFQDIQERRPASYRRITQISIIRWRLFRLVVFLLAFTHMLAPGFIFVSKIGERNSITHVRPSWIASYPFEQRADDIPLNLHQYCVAVYWFLTTLTTIGFGDITAKNPLEQIYTIMMMLASAAAFSYVTAIFSSIVNQLDSEKKVYVERMASLSAFIESYKLPQQLRIDIFRHFNNVWGNVEAKIEEKDILGEMPTALRNIATGFIYKDFIARTPILNGKSKSFISSLMLQAKAFQFKNGECIGHFGDTVNEWMMIAMGNVAMMMPDSNYELVVYEEGSSIGEIGIVFSDVWIADMKAQGQVSVWSVPRAAVIDLLKSSNDFMNEFAQTAKQRFESFSDALIEAKSNDEKAAKFLSIIEENHRDNFDENEFGFRSDNAAAIANHNNYMKMTSELGEKISKICSGPHLSSGRWIQGPLCIGSFSKGVTKDDEKGSGSADLEYQIKMLREQVDAISKSMEKLCSAVIRNGQINPSQT